MRSVLAYLKLWFKTDYSLLEQATTFQQLSTLYTKLIPKDIYQDSIIEKPQKELHFR